MNIIILSSIGKGFKDNGDGRYLYELRKKLNKIRGSNISLSIIEPKERLNLIRGAIYNLLILPIKLLRTNADLYHASAPGEVIAPILLRKRTVITLHDVIYITYPNQTRLIQRLYFYLCSYFIKKTDFVITSSDFSKREINRTLKIPLNKIKRIYLGIDKKFKYVNKTNDKKNIGYLGGQNGRKNVDSLIKAFHILQMKPNFKNHKLLLSFKPNKRIINLVNSLRIKNIEFLGGIPEDKIVQFYNSLDLFIFPSLYEGFGFPPLEAMASGCPVICFNKTSISEITGDAALKVNVANPNELAKNIEKVLTNSELRKQLRTKGLKKSKEYSWEKTARDTLKVYEKFNQ